MFGRSPGLGKWANHLGAGELVLLWQMSFDKHVILSDSLKGTRSDSDPSQRSGAMKNLREGRSDHGQICYPLPTGFFGLLSTTSIRFTLARSQVLCSLR